MIFGGGVQLSVESEEEYKPKYYKLNDTVCLATGFSRYSGTADIKPTTLTKPAMISSDKLYNQVLFLDNLHDCNGEFNPQQQAFLRNKSLYLVTGPVVAADYQQLIRPGCVCLSETSEEDGVSECSAGVEPDEKVNLASITIIGLRLIFLKTIVFNVLMTLRLWISQ
ncbi:M1-specific T cell receptor alpha chain-like [Cololabis saira]|uniref:M1-specific T cell receptor alpha chain-like n=1 Tax=Cololabis saira TaxID=129043 RepID=UPI002AD584A9|nr:M1-specific T cell receptor alpha chain-like [Cololabis saira]